MVIFLPSSRLFFNSDVVISLRPLAFTSTASLTAAFSIGISLPLTDVPCPAQAARKKQTVTPLKLNTSSFLLPPF
jgi:hypothetical protein